MPKIATLVMLLLVVGCAATGPDLAANLTTASYSPPESQGSVPTPANLGANAEGSDTSAISDVEHTETISSDEIVAGGEQVVCEYVIPAGSRIARRQCEFRDPIDVAVNEMIDREVVEQMRETSLRQRRAELERMMRGGYSNR